MDDSDEEWEDEEECDEYDAEDFVVFSTTEN